MTGPQVVKQGPNVRPGLSPFLGWLPRRLWVRAKDTFGYSAQFLPIAAGDTATFETAIQADSDFVWVATVREVLSTAAPPVLVPAPTMLVQFFDSGSGRNLFDRAVPLDNVAGTAQLPKYLEFPKVLRASATFQTQLQNLDGVNDRTVRLTFLGFKVFGYPAE